MKDDYTLKLQTGEEITLSEKQLSETDMLSLGNDDFHVLSKNRSFNARIVSSDLDKKEYSVEVNGNLYTVNILSDLDRLIKEMGFELGSAKKVNDVKAPMPGLILDILVNEGDEVKEDQNLLILEAMKMENVLASPRDGIIKKIAVNKGDAIVKGALLIEFE